MDTKIKNKEWYYEFSKLSHISPNGHYIIKQGEVGTPICLLPMPIGGINTKEKQLAKVKLLSASNVMLDALQSIIGIEAFISDSEMRKKFQEKVYSAIKKATK